MSASDGPIDLNTKAVAARIHQVTVGRGRIARDVLEDLHEWFGIPAAVDAYVADAEALPMLACLAPDGTAIGFVSLKLTSPFAAEISVMGVKKDWHRHGIGRALIEGARRFAISQNAKYLTVKTLAPSDPDENYARTRKFYEAVGFVPIEELPSLWGAENPCLFMLQSLRGHS